MSTTATSTRATRCRCTFVHHYPGRLIKRRDQALQRMSAGDLRMKWIPAVHLGAFGGLGAKILLVRPQPPLLALTDVIMWWRRVIPYHDQQ